MCRRGERSLTPHPFVLDTTGERFRQTPPPPFFNRVTATPMGQSYIFQVEDLTKKHGQKKVLEGVNLAFYPGAKIGVLGPNGAGKSTLMRIMAGTDTEFEGSAKLTKGYTAGYLEQEPPLDPTKTVFENVQIAVTERQAVLDRYNEITGLLGTETDDKKLEKLYDEMARLQDEIDAANLWELDRQVAVAMEVMNLPPGDSEITNLSGGEKRRVALCQLLIRAPTFCCSTNRPTTSTPKAFRGWSNIWPTTAVPSSL